MAESQVPYPYDDETIASLKETLSEPRFSTYLAKADGDENFAFALYLYNSRLSKSFLFPLSVAEVTFRNTIDALLEKEFGEDWPTDTNFRGELSQKSLEALEKGISIAERHAAWKGEKEIKRGDVVAELTFDFWSNLFRREYHEFWRPRATRAFPGLKHGEGRHEIQALVREINGLRNRVAHHEPILHSNVPDLQSKIIRLVSLRCNKTAEWMRHHSTVGAVMRTKPKKGDTAPVPLLSKADKSLGLVERSVSLINLAGDDFRQHAAFVCVEDGEVKGAFTHTQLSKYILAKSLALEGLVDLSDITVSMLLEEADVKSGFLAMPADAPLLDAVKELRKSKTQVVVALDPQSAAPVGVILRAHRRY